MQTESKVNKLITDLDLEKNKYPLMKTVHVISMLKVIQDIIKSSPPVEQTVDAGQLEKIIGDAYDAGFKQAINDYPDKAEYIKQAIELYNNFKS